MAYSPSPCAPIPPHQPVHAHAPVTICTPPGTPCAGPPAAATLTGRLRLLHAAHWPLALYQVHLENPLGDDPADLPALAYQVRDLPRAPPP